MVRCNKLSGRVSVKVKSNVVYANKASCVVLSHEARMNFARFCMLLMTVDKEMRNKAKDSPQKEQIKELNLRTKGSLISGPLLFNDYSLFLYFLKPLYIYQYLSLTFQTIDSTPPLHCAKLNNKANRFWLT